jgi:hypothetical protein
MTDDLKQESIITVKNAVPVGLHNYIKRIILSESFPWHYNDNISGTLPNTGDEIGFSNRFLDAGLNELLESILHLATQKHNTTVNNLERIRVGMFLKTPSRIIHKPHIDYDCIHTNMLYYLIDSDGPTYFYGDGGQVIKTVDPVEGTAVIFPGHIMHSSSTPVVSNRRVVLNFNFNLYET